MKFYIKNLQLLTRVFLLTIFFTSAIAFWNNLAFADSINSNSIEAIQQAAKKVTEDTGVKQQFGKSENGDRLLDNAQTKASEKLEEIARDAKSDGELPGSKKLFLDNLTAGN